MGFLRFHLWQGNKSRCIRSHSRISAVPKHFQVLVNSFSLRTDRLGDLGEAVGSGIFIAASAFDHSCKPNATTVFNGNVVSVLANQDIENFEDVSLINVIRSNDAIQHSSTLGQGQLCQHLGRHSHQEQAAHHHLVFQVPVPTLPGHPSRQREACTVLRRLWWPKDHQSVHWVLSP